MKKRYVVLGVLLIAILSAFLVDNLNYRLATVGYFIEDYWMILVAIVMAAVGFKQPEKKKKIQRYVVAMLLVGIYIGDYFYISEYEQEEAWLSLGQVSDIYDSMGLESKIEPLFIINTVRLPDASLSDVKSCEDAFALANLVILRKRYDRKEYSYYIYREIDEVIDVLRQGGGRVYTYIQNSSGENVCRASMKGADRFSMEKL